MADDADVWYETLSGGQKRRTCVATAIVNDPDLLFLDEPTTGIDPAGRRSIHRLIERLAGGGTTVFLTSHAMDEVERLADRVALLRDGKIVAVGAPEELIADHGGEPRLEVKLDGPASEADCEAVQEAIREALSDESAGRARTRPRSSPPARASGSGASDPRGSETPSTHWRRPRSTSSRSRGPSPRWKTCTSGSRAKSTRRGRSRLTRSHPTEATDEPLRADHDRGDGGGAVVPPAADGGVFHLLLPRNLSGHLRCAGPDAAHRGRAVRGAGRLLHPRLPRGRRAVHAAVAGRLRDRPSPRRWPVRSWRRRRSRVSSGCSRTRWSTSRSSARRACSSSDSCWR